MKEKIKYTVYAILYMLILFCALAWAETASQMFFCEPCLDHFALLVVCAFTMWMCIRGITFNISKIQILRALKWISDKEGWEKNDSKRED